MRRVALVFVLSCSAFSLFAAQANPAPQRALAKLAFLVGSWNVEELHPADGDHPASKGRGTLQVRSGPGGNSIVSDYHSTEGPMRGESGHQVITIGDGDAYRLFSFDSDSPSPQSWSGRWNGDHVVFEYSETIFDQNVKVQATLSEVARDSFTLTVVASSDQKPPATVMTLRCRKK